MRSALLIALLITTHPGQADVCREVETQSLGRIECAFDGTVWTLKYKFGALNAVKATGRHQEMINALCAEGGVGVRQIYWGGEDFINCFLIIDEL